MILIITKARKDAKALAHALKESAISLANLKFEKLSNKIPFFFFGKDDILIAEKIEKEIKEITPIYKIIKINKKKVRNARLSELIDAFELAKAELRLSVEFKENTFCFTLSPKLILSIHPDYDTYFLIGKNTIKSIEKIFHIKVKEGNLVLRKHFNEEEIYTPELKAILSKKRGESLKVIFHNEKVMSQEISLKDLIAKNKDFLEAWEKVAISFLRDNAEGEIGVPLSGGKDSTAALILATKAFHKVKALYVKTNYEMPFTEEYVEKLCKDLGIKLIKTYVEFDVKTYGMPTCENRWCTVLKLKALKKIATPTLIVGDRDSESQSRRKRKEVEFRIAKELFPLKYWSGAMVQLYVLMHDINLHPLYYQGFYRLGCSICPSLSDWEKFILKSFK